MIASIQFVVFSVFTTLALGETTAWDSLSRATLETSCSLQCANGGYCSLVDGTTAELAYLAQSGALVEKCICPEGYGGIACEYVVEECSFPDRTCSNGQPCRKDANGDWGCECSAADAASTFAGYQCTNPTTEYCSGKYDPNSVVTYCTNGGRCVGDFLAAQVAPGDTSFNKVYQFRGCTCPANFYGPHCEFLSGEDSVSDGEIAKLSPIAIAALSMMSLSMVLMGIVVRRKLMERKVPREIAMEHGTPWPRQGYRDSRFNGQHIAARNINIRMESAFEDAEFA